MAAAEPFVVDGSTITLSAAVGCCPTDHADPARCCGRPTGACTRASAGARGLSPSPHGTWGDVVPAWICVRCGVQYPDTAAPPASCPICEDEREAVPEAASSGRPRRSWARPRHRNPDEEPGLIGVGVTP